MEQTVSDRIKVNLRSGEAFVGSCLPWIRVQQIHLFPASGEIFPGKLREPGRNTVNLPKKNCSIFIVFSHLIGIIELIPC